MNPALATLLEAATRAPSGDNTQPWQFIVDEAAGRIAVALDPSRDPSPMNAGQRMSRIALGAALENMLRTAQSNGWEVEMESSYPATLVLQGCDWSNRPGLIDPAISQRVVNRRPYDARPVPTELLLSLQQRLPDHDGVRTCWITDRSRLAEWADLVGRADVTLFGDAAMRRAFLANVRFDAAAQAEVAEGLSVASLELGKGDRIALQLARCLPNWLLRGSGALRKFATHAARLVTSASGLCLIVAPDSREETDLSVGRAVQRAWLALTAAGLAVQPMMSLLALENLLDHGPPEQIASLGRENLLKLRQELAAQAPEIEAGRPAFLLRFGHALAPSGRTGRRPWQEMTTRSARVDKCRGAMQSI